MQKKLTDLTPLQLWAYVERWVAEMEAKTFPWIWGNLSKMVDNKQHCCASGVLCEILKKDGYIESDFAFKIGRNLVGYRPIGQVALYTTTLPSELAAAFAELDINTMYVEALNDDAEDSFVGAIGYLKAKLEAKAIRDGRAPRPVG